MQVDKLQICKVQGREIPFPQSSKKKVIMTSSFDKNNLGEDPFTTTHVSCNNTTPFAIITGTVASVIAVGG